MQSRFVLFSKHRKKKKTVPQSRKVGTFTAVDWTNNVNSTQEPSAFIKKNENISSWIAKTCLYTPQAFRSTPLRNIARDISTPDRNNTARGRRSSKFPPLATGRERNRRAFQTAREYNCRTGLNRIVRAKGEAGQRQGTSHVEKLYQAPIFLQQCARLCICIYILPWYAISVNHSSREKKNAEK